MIYKGRTDAIPYATAIVSNQWPRRKGCPSSISVILRVHAYRPSSAPPLKPWRREDGMDQWPCWATHTMRPVLLDGSINIEVRRAEKKGKKKEREKGRFISSSVLGLILPTRCLRLRVSPSASISSQAHIQKDWFPWCRRASDGCVCVYCFDSSLGK